jgi:hypothetical protein
VASQDAFYSALSTVVYHFLQFSIGFAVIQLNGQ